jgi:post-segregation antitoxin (ccd killing protein)
MTRCGAGSTAPSTAGENASAPDVYAHRCYHQGVRTSVVFDDELAAEARQLGINVSEAARDGLRRAVRQRRAERDRAAYVAHPEAEDDGWDDAEAWAEP